ncbi:MAG: urea ABC transporter substrate-binding protein, partial [Oligoflexia bacterium]|nr:urea ABC transporter substrate-binding protein [Oligoflexia bacterium]
LTGTMAESEIPLKNATLMAIDEINESGGLIGKKIVPIVVDGKSDWPTSAKEAERLIVEEKVKVVFGCWTSACRKTVKPIFEKYNNLLFYPLQYEGLESSPNIIYTGATANQQIIPAIRWSYDNLGKKFFLVGSDYIFPRVANKIVKLVLEALGGTLLGEEYVLLGSNDFSKIAEKIAKTKPDVIINTINGDSNISFMKEIQKLNIWTNKTPVMFFSVGESELQAMKDLSPNLKLEGNYACWNYFQSIDSVANKNFVARFKKKFGENSTINDPMFNGYLGVNLWSTAVKNSLNEDIYKNKRLLYHFAYPSPEGVVSFDRETNHLWKTVRIGKIKKDLQFEIIWSSGRPIRPRPYPETRFSRKEWKQFVEDLYEGWGRHWANVKKI